MERLLFLISVCAFLRLTTGYSFFPARIPNVGAVSRIPAPSTIVNGIGQTCRSIGHKAQCGGPPSGGGNPFGRTFFDNGQKWNRVICTTDSDGDGYTNGEELGDPQCRWTEANPTALLTANLSHPGFSCSTPQNPYCQTFGSQPTTASGTSGRSSSDSSGSQPTTASGGSSGGSSSDSSDDEKPSWKVAVGFAIAIGVLKFALIIVNAHVTCRASKQESKVDLVMGQSAAPKNALNAAYFQSPSKGDPDVDEQTKE